MSTYTRRGMETETHPAVLMGAPVEENAAEASTENGVRMDGYGQVLAMLQIADPEFRESLLRRLGARDPGLAAQLRANLRDLDF